MAEPVVLQNGIRMGEGPLRFAAPQTLSGGAAANKEKTRQKDMHHRCKSRLSCAETTKQFRVSGHGAEGGGGTKRCVHTSVKAGVEFLRTLHFQAYRGLNVVRTQAWICPKMSLFLEKF